MCFEIILVNDGSSDNSLVCIQDYIDKYTWKNTFKIIDYGQNKWKWFAVKQWIETSSWEYIIIQDADLEYNPQDIKGLLTFMKNESLDFVYGSRTLGIKKYSNHYSSISFFLWWALLSCITSIITWTRVTDEPTCYKLFHSSLKQYLIYPDENWFEWEPAITVLLLRKKASYGEYPIHYSPRDFAHGKKIWWRDGIKWIYTLCKWRIKNIKDV